MLEDGPDGPPNGYQAGGSVQDCVSVLVSTFLDGDVGTFSSLFIGNRTQMFLIRLLGNRQLKRDVGTISSCVCGNRTSRNMNFSYPWPQWFLCLTWNCTPKLRFNITRVYGYGQLGWVIVNNQSIGQIKRWRQRQGFIFLNCRWGKNMFEPNPMVTHPTIVEILQSGPKWWTDRIDGQPTMSSLWLKQQNRLSVSD